jgi:hypothetical protein
LDPVARQQRLNGLEPPARSRNRREDTSSTYRGKVRVHDPFELLRWLALSQPDPRKALAELVQNSLDAGARSVEVTRLRRSGVPCLSVRDDGEGIIPELPQAEALRYIATHIGHSRKRALTPQERLQLMTQGQYGIGLLGFWSLGQRLEIRVFRPGEEPHRLVLYRESPDFEIEPLRHLPRATDGGARATEVLVVGLHREALPVLAARRAADFLAAELRGQLLHRDVELVVRDRIARGRGAKRIAVQPRRFLGERLEGVGALEVAGYPPAQLELYYSGGRDPDGDAEAGAVSRQAVALYATGTLVVEGFAQLGALGLDHRPWTDRRLTGLVDFGSLTVAPGSRRGVVPDAAAAALADALRGVEPIVQALLDQKEQRRAEELDRSMVRDLQHAFRDLYRQLPRYALLPVDSSTRDAAAGPPSAGDQEPELPEAATPAAEAQSPPGEPEPAEPDPEALTPFFRELIEAGPLASLEIRPRPLRVISGGHRTVRAAPRDELGLPIARPLELRWDLPAELGRIVRMEDDPLAARIEAASLDPGENERRGELLLVAHDGTREASAVAAVTVLSELPAARSDEGIPEPELVDAPGAEWRSRIHAGRWEVNAGHPGYRAVVDRPGLKLRYLALLFAKEVVARSAADPRLEEPLEQLVEVASFADHRLDERRGGGRRRRKNE